MDGGMNGVASLYFTLLKPTCTLRGRYQRMGDYRREGGGASEGRRLYQSLYHHADQIQ